MDERRWGRANREKYVVLSAVLATLMAGTALGRWLDPTPRSSALESAVPFAFPDFSFRDEDGATVTRKGLSGRTWLASFALPTCDDSSALVERQLRGLDRIAGSDVRAVTFWVGAGDDWRSSRARGAPPTSQSRRVVAADPTGDGGFLDTLNLVAGRPGPRPLEEWTRSLLLVDPSGLVRAIYDAGDDDSAARAAADLNRAWPVGRSAPTQARALPARPWLSFTARDQDGRFITERELRGKVVIVDFIYTSCSGVCPTLSARMVAAQRRLPGDGYWFLSFSVDPERDTPEVLKAYAARWTQREERWRLLASDSRTVLAVADALRANVSAGDGAVMHSDRFVLVGSDGVARGSYAVTEVGEVDRLVRDAQALEHVAQAHESPVSTPNGAELLLALGCMGCHAERRLAPPLEGLLGQQVQLVSGGTIVANETYLRRSILEPARDVVAGYGATMPSYAGLLAPAEVDALVRHLLSEDPGPASSD